jgi:hypothetical protein
LGDGISAAKIEEHNARTINAAGVTAQQHTKQKNAAVNPSWAFTHRNERDYGRRAGLLAQMASQKLLSLLGSIKLSIRCSQSSIDCLIAAQ